MSILPLCLVLVGHGVYDLTIGRPGNDVIDQMIDKSAHGDALPGPPRFIGRPPGETDFTFDGMRINDPGFNLPLFRPVADLVGEVSLTTGAVAVDSGPYAGGTMDFHSPGGTNIVRGEARVGFIPRLVRPRLTLLPDEVVSAQRVPGLGLQVALRAGGPILRDRLFWTVGAVVDRAATTLRQTFRGPHGEFADQTYPTSSVEAQVASRVDFLLNPRHRLWVASFVAPRFVRRAFRRLADPADFPGLRQVDDPLTRRPTSANGLLGGALGWDRSNAVSAVAGYDGRVARDRLEINTRFGFLQGKSVEGWRLDDPDLAELPRRDQLHPEGRELVDILTEDDALDAVPAVRQSCGRGGCPVRRWTSGGIGPTQWSRSRRLGGTTSLTHYFRGFGTHEFSYGIEAEHTERRRELGRAQMRRVAAQNYALFLGDRWALLSNLYVEPGLRWDAQDVRDRFGRRTTLIARNVAPRGSVVYDWTDEGRSRLYAGWGHHYQQLPLALFDEAPRASADLRGQYDSVFAAGYDQEVVEDWILGVGWTHRSLKQAVVPTMSRRDLVLANRRPLRNADAFTFTVQRRFGFNWLLMASYTYSREVGNYDGFLDPFTGRVARSLAEPEMVRNSFGPLTRSRPHRLKLDAFYIFDFSSSGRLLLGAGARVLSGRPVSVKAGSVYVLPRGAGGRLEPMAALNLNADYSYDVGPVVLGVRARLFNVTNAAAIIAVEQQYTRQRTRPIAGGDSGDVKHARVHSSSDPNGFFSRRLVRSSEHFTRPLAHQLPLSGQFDLQVLF